jgi:glycerol-3-phosphate dehydrogenase (NAD(P)+)
MASGQIKTTYMQSVPKIVGVIGAGSFGTAIANLLAANTDVLIYSRNPEVVEAINQDHFHLGITLSPRIQATSDLQLIANNCRLLFPIVPSDNFRAMMKALSPFLHPYHILIHGTKGFDLGGNLDADSALITRRDVSTMSEIIRQESVVVRIGCLSGPNLAREIMDGQPTATVIASRFDEVIKLGQRVLSSKQFQVFSSHELLGAELAGALKNTIAIGSGILYGLGMGKNIQALLITRGLMEMIIFGKAMGASHEAFLGTAGIGDLVCTATSKKSRNFTFGMRLGQGEPIEYIKSTMPELAEGIRTIAISRQLAHYYNLQVPINELLYRIIYENYPIDRALEFLMRIHYQEDINFLDQ